MSDSGDALDSATGILGTAIGGMIAIKGIQMMGDMVNNMNKNQNNMNEGSRLKAQNTLNFDSEPHPRHEQKSYSPPRQTQKPQHNYFKPSEHDFFSPDIPQRGGESKKKQKDFWDW